MGPVLQLPAAAVPVAPGAVTVMVVAGGAPPPPGAVVGGGLSVVVGEPQRFSRGAGVATARAEKARRT